MLATESVIGREAFDLAELPDGFDLVAELRRVNEQHGRQGAPCWFLFSGAEFPGLTVGVHGDRGALLWEDETASMVPAQGSGEPADYFTGGVHHFTFPPGAELPVDRVLDAVGEYVRTGQRPARLQWEAA